MCATDDHPFTSTRLPLGLLVVGLFLATSSNATQKVSFSCIKQGGNPMIVIFVVVSNDVVKDIFAKGAQKSCGLSAKNITGLGKEDIPYRFVIDLKGVGDTSHGVCGVVKKGDIAELTLITRTSQGKFASTIDKATKIKCDFSKGNANAVNTKLGVNLIEQKATEENINITLQFEGSPSELVVGSRTYLEMKLWTLKHFSKILPFKCWAMRNSTDENKVLLLDNYCPVSDAPIKLEFDFYQSYSRLRSKIFSVFRFFDSEILQVRCLVDICLEAQDCVKVTCTSKVRRSILERPHRSANAETSIVIRDQGSPKLPGFQLPLSFLGTVVPLSVVVVILIAVIVSLNLKLEKQKRISRRNERL